MELDVSSLARKEQTVKKIPAAAFVITAEDIRRSGASSLPEVLRMVPGMNVAKINSSNWAVSARGFNDLYANKLQVMIDGRSIYDPLVSGVYWGQQNPFLQDIERIEVIRGPSGTLWGANAVNGTINIVTRSAKDTQGGLISARGGNMEQGGGIRYGAKLGESTYMRGSANGLSRDANTNLANQNNTHDFGHAQTGNFRLDSELSNRDKLMMQAEVSRYDLDGYFIGVSSPTPPLWSQNDFGRTGVNASMQGHWLHSSDSGHNWKVNMAFTYTDWLLAVNQMSRSNYVLDLQDSFPAYGAHNLMWGLNFQTVSDQFNNSLTLAFKPDNFTQNNVGVFLQDQIDLSTNLKLTLANRLEHFTFTGWETEPNIRMMWTPNKYHSVWAAVSRSVVLPNRAQHSINLFVPIPGQQTFLMAVANPEMKTENLLAYELGWRWQIANNLQADTALFYNIYDRMQGTIFSGPPQADPVYGYIQYATVGNFRQVKSYGVELSLNYRVNHDWRLQASYSHIRFDTRFDPSQVFFRNPLTELNSDPQQTLSLRSQYDLSSEIELDVWGRFVDKLTIDHTGIPSYFALDLRLGWRPVKDLELSLSGQNLLDNQHPEFSDSLYIPVSSQILRSYSAQINWHF